MTTVNLMFLPQACVVERNQRNACIVVCSYLENLKCKVSDGMNSNSFRRPQGPTARVIPNKTLVLLRISWVHARHSLEGLAFPGNHH